MGGSFGGRAHPPPTLLLPLPQAEDVCATNHGCVGWLASLEEVPLIFIPLQGQEGGSRLRTLSGGREMEPLLMS